MSDVIVAAIIGLLGTLIATFVGLLSNKELKRKVSYFTNKACIRFIEQDENFKDLLGKVSNISMYTVNSYELQNKINTILELNKNINIKKLTIMVRKKDDENQADLDILNNIIAMWENWVKRKRIKTLIIIAYNHDPDHYYTIIGDRIVFSGQVLFDKAKPTGTTIDYKPLVFGDDTDVGKQVIKNYKNHFDNAVSNYKECFTLYDSSKK